MLGNVGDGLLRQPDSLDQLVDATLEQIELGGVGSTQAASTLDDRRQDGVDVPRRAANCREHLVSGVELILQSRVAAPQSLMIVRTYHPSS